MTRVFVTGATGFLGRAGVEDLVAGGAQVAAWVRGAPPPGVEPVAVSGGAEALARAVDEADAIVNLAGEPVAGRRWTASRRRALVASRVETTRAIARALGLASPRPRVLVSASAVGIYGDRGDEVLTESSPRGTGFLADLCAAWEHEALAARSAQTRVVVLRIGVVLGRGGGALEKLVPLFRVRLGGPIGSGAQWMSWIHRTDFVRVLRTAIEETRAQGILNATAPEAVRNVDFVRALGRALDRPTILPVPALALQLLYGEAASVLLEGQRAHPAGLEALGFEWRFPTLQDALTDVLADSGGSGG